MHEGYTCSLETIFWKKYSWHFLTHHKYLRSRKHQIILQGIVLCLRWSYTYVWKSSPGPFHHLTETTRIKFQADFSLLQNLYIQTYILHIVFISWKHQPLPRTETSDIQRKIWDYLPQSCNAVSLKGIKTLHMKHFFFIKFKSMTALTGAFSLHDS